jgi:galactose mutarotase-like enzyme
MLNLGAFVYTLKLVKNVPICIELHKIFVVHFSAFLFYSFLKIKMADAQISIANETIKTVINSTGAELCSLINRKTKLEYMWQAGKAWPKHAPVLFPIVGQLKNNVYKYQDNYYQLERHGFARNQQFDLILHQPDAAHFQLKSNIELLQNFPFIFELNIYYHVVADGLKIRYEVKNPGASILLFSIGGHPAFRIPLMPGEAYEDYELIFNKKETVPRWTLKDGLIDKPVLYLKHQDRLALSKTLFADDALVFKNLKSNSIAIVSTKHTHGLNFNFNQFPYFGIWAAHDADFVCLEPWFGIADSTEGNKDLIEKEGIQQLMPGASFNCTYSIHPF